MTYRPKLDPKRDLAGATPETLALALLGKKPKKLPGAGSEPVVGDEAPVEQPPADETGDGVPHLGEGS